MEKRARRSLHPNDGLCRQYEGRWSGWQTLMSFYPPAYEDYRQRAEIGYRLSLQEIRNRFGEERIRGPGIYEMGVTRSGHDGIEVVYLGKAVSLLKRIKAYTYDGSHKCDYIHTTLYHGYDICIRVLMTTNPDAAESELLWNFSYDWNKKYPRKRPSQPFRFEARRQNEVNEYTLDYSYRTEANTATRQCNAYGFLGLVIVTVDNLRSLLAECMLMLLKQLLRIVAASKFYRVAIRISRGNITEDDLAGFFGLAILSVFRFWFPKYTLLVFTKTEQAFAMWIQSIRAVFIRGLDSYIWQDNFHASSVT